MTLTERQQRVLAAIIQEFIETARAVGSLTLSDKYELGVSPATLRAEMARLVDQGYLLKAHTSAGRIPTTLGIRFFLNEILEEDELDKLRETEIKERMYQRRFNRSRFISEAVRGLADMTGLAGVGLVDETIFTSGLGQLLSNVEFEDIELLQKALEIIESEQMLTSLFSKASENTRNVRILIGDEMNMDALNECSVVYSPFRYFRGSEGYIGVIGPRRMNYSRTIPAVRLVTNFVQNSVRGWE